MTLSTHREVERKYDATEGIRLPAWSRLAPERAGTGEQTLEAIYYDTPDLRLAADGFTLRHRDGDEATGWQLKVPVGPDTREEIRFTAPRDPGPPAELVSLLRATTRDAALVEIARLTTRRRIERRRNADGQDVLTITDDRVQAVARAGNLQQSWREIEVELGAHGSRELLERADRTLVRAGLQRSTSTSKLARALGEIGSPRDPGVERRSGTVGAAVLAYLATQAAALRLQDLRVRRDQPDSVHQMRVATRRLRSALQAYGRVVDRAGTRALTDELRWLAGVLGEARDTEVLRDRITAESAALEPELVLGPVSARIDKFFAPRQATARRHVLAALDGGRYLALLAGVDDLLRDPPLSGRAGRKAGPELRKTLDRQLHRVNRRLVAADRVGEDRGTHLHEARKAAKRLRYAAEAAAPVLGRPAGRLVKQSKKFQDLLGEHQDAVVAAPVLREIGISAYRSSENAWTFGLLAGATTAGGPVDETNLTMRRERLFQAAHRAIRA